jgi:hypothetical protein
MNLRTGVKFYSTCASFLKIQNGIAKMAALIEQATWAGYGSWGKIKIPKGKALNSLLINYQG